MSKKILFIEDESTLQRTVTHALTKEGFSILSALDGDTGLAMAKKELPNLILLDLILPKKDGFVVLDELKKDPDTKNIPIVILSNLENNKDVERALAAGAMTYLIKTNYRMEEVIEKIKKYL
jgi:DNA-binding response OmpR family regulator